RHLMTHWTAPDLDAREDSAAYLSDLDAAAREDARAHWDGWEPDTDTDEPGPVTYEDGPLTRAALKAVQKDRERWAS
ncbi:MAG: hypothetical protein Q4G67_13320, partial [Actinomycetia bacterium]|nr:hypothetical protein [Actinomycetes bacterium]